MGEHDSEHCTQEEKVGGSLWVQVQPGLQELVPRQASKLQRKTPSWKQKQNKASWDYDENASKLKDKW